MATYSFTTVWVLECERERVWEALWDGPRWPDWWPGCISIYEDDPGDAIGIGRSGVQRWRARLPYTLAFRSTVTEVDRPRAMAGTAVGELSGTGRWRLLEDQGTTTVVYLWEVETTRSWMNVLAPLAAPLFRANHDYLMRRGGAGLAKHLDCRLTSGHSGPSARI